MAERARTRPPRRLIPGEVLDPAPPRLRRQPQAVRGGQPPRPPHWQRDLGWVLCWVAVATALLTLAVLVGSRATAPPAPEPSLPPVATTRALAVEVDAHLDVEDVLRWLAGVN